jgi:hypothetical protein
MLVSKIELPFEIHDRKRICQGDILRDFSFRSVAPNKDVTQYDLLYVIVISQDCDLDHGVKPSYKNQQDSLPIHNQYLPFLLLLPAFNAQDLREGKHIERLFNIRTKPIGGDLYKPIKQNLNPRYHFIEGISSFQAPDLIVDFKIFFSVPLEVVQMQYHKSYLVTINELFREDLSQRFASYLSRIALPEIQTAITEDLSQVQQST